MGYCELDDIKKLLDPKQVIALSDDDLDGDPDAEIIAAVIAAADSNIDSYLANRYTVPIFPVPEILKKYSAILSIYHLFDRRQLALIPEKWQNGYDYVIEELTKIADGEKTLGVPGLGTVSGIQFSKESSEATFTFDSLKHF